MKRPLFVIAGGFVLGEVLGLHDRSAVVIFLAAVLTAAFILILRKKDGNGPFIGLLLFFILFGYWRADLERSRCDREAALQLDGEKGSICGKVERIYPGKGHTEMLIRPAGGELRYLLIYADDGNISQDGGLSVGTEICASGKYSAFGEAANPGQFDYAAHYRAQKLSYRFFADHTEIVGLSQNLYDRCRDCLRRLSGYLSDILDSIADPEDAGILRSLLLGDRSGLDESVSDLYRKNGISHLLAISGLHLSLISMAVYGMLRRTGPGFGWSGMLGAVILLGYCIMSGAPVSSLRALIMVLTGYLAAFMGRTYDLLTSLGLAAFLLFLDSPYQLTRSGPQLSFLAIMGIAASSVFCSDQKRAGKGIKRYISGALSTSAGIQLVTAPVILWNFFRFPLYGIFINLLVLPLLGCVVASGAAGMLAGALSLSLGRLFLGPAHYILAFYDFLCRFFGSLPFSSLLLGRPSPCQIVVYYTALILIFFYGIRRGDRQKSAFHLLPLLILLFPLPVINCSILFMDVGQGDGILIRSAAGVVLVDGGSSSVNDLYGERLLPCLESLAVSDIDYAIVSHGHADHTNGVYMLLSAESPVRVKNLILPAAGRGDESYDRLISRAGEAGIPSFWMETGDVIDMGRMRFTCIYPDESGGSPAADANEHSLVIRLDYGGFSMLMGGDMTEKGECEILADPSHIRQLSGIQVLKVAHHGSSTSSSGPWLDAVSPVWAVISYGRNNSYGHPGEDTMTALSDRDITVYETAKAGAVSLWTDGKSIRWDCFADP